MSRHIRSSTGPLRRPWPLIVVALIGVIAIAGGIAGAGGSSGKAAPWSETFDGAPSSPQAFHPDGWDIQYHIRDIHRWEEPDPVDAHHGPNCEPPLDTHEVTQWRDSVYTCANHMMTAINGAAGYGLLYVTPDRMVDFSGGDAKVSFEISTFRTNDRDWWDVWITPFDDNLARPFELGQVDLHGTPPEAVQVRLGGESQVCLHVIKNYDSTEYCNQSKRMTEITSASGDVEMARQRETVEIHFTGSGVEVTMPDHGETLAEAPVQLPFDKGVVQFGHHSYTPGKNDSGGDGANTWHWDNIEINPSAPFTMIGTDTFMLKGSDDESEVVTLDEPAPANAYLRFAAVSGQTPNVSFDGGPFEPAEMQPIDPGVNESETLAKNYWTPIPEGTREVRFELFGTWSGASNRYVSGIGVWSQGSGGGSAPAPTNTPTAEPTETEPTPEPTATSTPEPAATATSEPTNTPEPTATSTSEPTNTPEPTATSTLEPTATPTPGDGGGDDGGDEQWTMSAAVSDSSIETGERQMLNIRVRSEQAERALVDVEIYGPDGEKFYQRYWDDRRFNAGQARNFIVRGLIPDGAARGEYVVKVGIFQPQPAWGQFLAFEESAATFQVE